MPQMVKLVLIVVNLLLSGVPAKPPSSRSRSRRIRAFRIEMTLGALIDSRAGEDVNTLWMGL
jgi:hypothetical protein